ncbi:MAG: tetratricopeptide repeat protein [Planctomycetes bacterium]|nr:tetratricopeptide repeat protein [Planctomycetota bacterium]MCB9870923.1 tetratricopeptide repeat protein [Planctomycetota bacterium]MCB9888287.1 tetratricopeptide repeat protein [Planctomycetota bacterium]
MRRNLRAALSTIDLSARVRDAALLLLCATPAVAQVSGEDFRARAFAAYSAGKLAEASDLFMRLFHAGAADRDLLRTGAECLEKNQRFNDALDVLARGKKQFPDDEVFRVALARVYNLKAAGLLKSTGKLDTNAVFNFQDAIREAKELLATKPDNRDARLILANSYYTIGKWEEAKQQADELVKRFPAHPGGHIVLGDLAFEHFKLHRQKLNQKGADTTDATMQKVAGARESARNSYSEAIRLDPERLIAHYKLGDLCAWNGETKQALAHYRAALLLDPNAPVSHSWVASSLDPAARYAYYEQLGKDYLTKPGADKSKAALLVWYAANAQAAQKKYLEAEQLYTLSASFNPSYAQGHYYAMYYAYYNRKDQDAALLHAARYAAAAPIEFADLVRASSERESVTQLIDFLARQAMNKNNLPASRDLNRVLAALVDTADAWNNYAFMARESGQFDASEKAYRHALEIEPTSGQLMNDLAVILHFHKRTVESWREAERLYVAAGKAAKSVLADSRASKARKDSARVTVRDAGNNLRDLRALMKQFPKGPPKNK